MFTEERSLKTSGRLFVAALIVLTLSACKGGPVHTGQTMADSVSVTSPGADNLSDQSTTPAPYDSGQPQTETSLPPAFPDTSPTDHPPADSARHSGKAPAETTHTLTWTAPATREDGSKLYLSEIKGYRIHYRLRHQKKFRVIRINDSSRTRYPLVGFKPGAYEFAITTIDMSDRESHQSGLVVADLY